MYETFKAFAQGACDMEVEIFSAHFTNHTNPVMVVSTPDAAIYITKEQAMKFFGLVDPNT